MKIPNTRTKIITSTLIIRDIKKERIENQYNREFLGKGMTRKNEFTLNDNEIAAECLHSEWKNTDAMTGASA